jgi:hypothetical protein
MPFYLFIYLFIIIIIIIIMFPTGVETVTRRSVCDLLSAINCRIFTKFGIGCPYRIYGACMIFVKIGSVILMLY